MHANRRGHHGLGGPLKGGGRTPSVHHHEPADTVITPRLERIRTAEAAHWQSSRPQTCGHLPDGDSTDDSDALINTDVLVAGAIWIAGAPFSAGDPDSEWQKLNAAAQA